MSGGDRITRWWDATPLARLDRAQWEALCDGCGKCCMHKLEDEETGEVFATNVACRLLNRRTGRCLDYANRRAFVPDCVKLSARGVEALDWLPTTCAYRLRSEGRPLPAWHHLNSGSFESVHEAGASVRGWTISEDDAGDLEQHIVDRVL